MKNNSHTRPRPARGSVPAGTVYFPKSMFSPLDLAVLLSSALNFNKGSSVINCGLAAHNTSRQLFCRLLCSMNKNISFWVFIICDTLLQLCHTHFFLRVQVEGETHHPFPQGSRARDCFFSYWECSFCTTGRA